MSARVYVSLLARVLLLAGCAKSRELMPTPKLYADGHATLFEALPQEYASTQVELIYVTDRAPETDEAGNLRYGHKRSNSLGGGTTVVDLGRKATSEELVENIHLIAHSRGTDVALSAFRELVLAAPGSAPGRA